MSEPFLPAATAPAECCGPALHFAFRGDRLLVRLVDGRARVPRIERPEDLHVPFASTHYLGFSPAHGHCFAVELADDGPVPDGMVLQGLRRLYGSIDEEVLWLGGRAVQIVDWHRDHQYCGRCGAATRAHEAERSRVCPDCGLTSFPRLSPAVITLVHRGDELLLARNHRFPPGRYSIIAGFVEPGETLEEAVAREIREEVGIGVRDIRYFGSQPWPFPNSLMVGFSAAHANGDLCLADGELADAGWYGRDRERLPDLPDGLSISRRLIDAFLAGRLP